MALSAIIVLLEALPYGVVLSFAASADERLRVTYSFFSLIPFGYASFGPLIAAALSCISLFFAAMGWFFDKFKWVGIITRIAPVAAAASFFPLGFSQLSALGLVIVALLMLQFLLCLKIRSLVSG